MLDATPLRAGVRTARRKDTCDDAVVVLWCLSETDWVGVVLCRPRFSLSLSSCVRSLSLQGSHAVPPHSPLPACTLSSLRRVCCTVCVWEQVSDFLDDANGFIKARRAAGHGTLQFREETDALLTHDEVPTHGSHTHTACPRQPTHVPAGTRTVHTHVTVWHACALSPH